MKLETWIKRLNSFFFKRWRELYLAIFRTTAFGKGSTANRPSPKSELSLFFYHDPGWKSNGRTESFYFERKVHNTHLSFV